MEWFLSDESPDSFLYWQQSVDKLGSKLCKHYVSMFELIDKNETQRENIMSKIYSEWGVIHNHQWICIV